MTTDTIRNFLMQANIYQGEAHVKQLLKIVADACEEQKIECANSAKLTWVVLGYNEDEKAEIMEPHVNTDSIMFCKNVATNDYLYETEKTQQ